MLTDERVARMDEILARRSRNLTVVIEDLYDPHNIAAVLRTCDAFGIQDVHAVPGPQAQGRFRPSAKVAIGAARWLTVHAWDGPAECIANLKQRGYAIAVSDLEASVPIDDVDFGRKTALVFGNEHQGVTHAMRELADTRFHIPMRGFVQSLNISVAAALAIHHGVRERDRLVPGGHGDLPEADRVALRSRWIVEDVPRGPEVLAEMKRRQN